MRPLPNHPFGDAAMLLSSFAEMFEGAAASGESLMFPADLVSLFGPALREALHEVYALQIRAKVADEIEAVARDLDLIGHARTGQIGPKMGELVDLREALTREQRVLQAALDAGQDEVFIDLTRPENGNVVSFPGRSFQPRSFDNGGDAA